MEGISTLIEKIIRGEERNKLKITDEEKKLLNEARNDIKKKELKNGTQVKSNIKGGGAVAGGRLQKKAKGPNPLSIKRKIRTTVGKASQPAVKKTRRK